MKQIFQIIAFVILGLSFGCNNTQIKNNLDEYILNKGNTPEKYILDKFNSHDFVFIGEYHRIKHDVDLILKLIPQLHNNNVNNLAIEFGNYQDQYLVDSLLLLPHFDRELAKTIIFKMNPLWGYKEYIDIYKVAWEVNQSKSKQKFRIINLGAKFDPCKKGGAWKSINPDIFMANVIFKELVDKNEKALIYSGNHHAFTKYHMPLYDFEKDTLWGMNTSRMGNVIYDSIKENTFHIVLHAPWISDKGWFQPTVLPVNGVIDSIINKFENKHIGFDIKNSPFGNLESNNSYYAFGYPNFTLDKFCDGYIYHSNIKSYEPVTIEKNFISDNNIEELKAYLLCTKKDKGYVDSLDIESANKLIESNLIFSIEHLKK